jgi:Formamidopyrimidine-DNA glycosylase N-terminal domain
MPELPDVEAYRRTLRDHALGKRIRAVQALDPAVLRNSGLRAASSKLVRHSFVASERHGVRRDTAHFRPRRWVAGPRSGVPCANPISSKPYRTARCERGGVAFHTVDSRDFGETGSGAGRGVQRDTCVARSVSSRPLASLCIYPAGTRKSCCLARSYWGSGGWPIPHNREVHTDAHPPEVFLACVEVTTNSVGNRVALPASSGTIGRVPDDGSRRTAPRC